MNAAPFYIDPIDPKSGKWTRAWREWISQVDRMLGSGSGIIPEQYGGTGVSSLAGLAAAFGDASSTGGGSALTQSKTATLNRPATNESGDFADTTITWDTPFADATYDPTISLTSGRYGDLTYVSQTANDITVRLTNRTDNFTIVHGEPQFYVAYGNASVTGVHA